MTVNEMIAKLTYIAEIGGGDHTMKVWYTDDNYQVHERDVDMVAASFTDVGAKENSTTIFLKK